MNTWSDRRDQPDDVTMDVAIVIGANDVVNPAARDVKSSPIYGMPIISVDEARCVFVLKPSMASDFHGIETRFSFSRTLGAPRRRRNEPAGSCD
jgi:NAD/NADP transhydrogenase beta subunit